MYGFDAVVRVQDIKQERDAAARQIENEAKRIADKLGLELDKSVKLEWHKANNVSVRCMRITKTEVCERGLRLGCGRVGGATV